MKKLRNFSGESLADEASKRRAWLEKELGIGLGEMGIGVDEVWRGRNIENVVGTVRVPVGVAGPVSYKLEGEFGSEEVEGMYLPLATTEGALVASVARGCKVLRLAERVVVRVEDLGMSRAPVFRVSGVGQAKKIEAWLDGNFSLVEKVASEGERYIKLREVETYLVGRSLFVRLVFLTGEAMGMNMVTMAAEKVSKLIEDEFGVECVALTGNVCCDKKPAGVNWFEGRGKRVWVESVVKKEVVEGVLGARVERLLEVFERKTLVGSVVARSEGFNAQAANVVAAMFLATGQDMAHVVHGSVAVTSMEEVGRDLYAAVYVPGLPVGTVGGGTGGGSQKAGLGMLGLDKVRLGDASRLAGAIGAGVLAGELSLHGALASGDLARAHQVLGRGGGNG